MEKLCRSSPHVWGKLDVPQVEKSGEAITLPHRAFVRGSGANLMRVPDYVLKCVGFVACYTSSDSTDDSYDLEGTGFFVSVPASTAGFNFGYFVTAKHVAMGLKDRPIALIVNDRAGGVTVLEDVDGHWYFHPTDPSVDVAVTPFIVTSNIDIMSITTRSFVDQALIGTTIGIGDEVFLPGLFTYAPGTKRNMPILRSGTIAMIPDDPIQVESGFAEAYLIEARSIGGLSGSPVFARRTTSVTGENDKGDPIYVHGLGGEAYLLGLMHGHWDIRESEMNAARFSHDSIRGVNLGIGVVVPAHKILDVINSPLLIAARLKVEERHACVAGPNRDAPGKLAE